MSVDKKSNINWIWNEQNKTWEAKFPVEVNGQKGEWLIWMTERPFYCDRGRWSVGVDGIGCSGPDDQEGFTRYFFSIENAKWEMEEWVKMRQEILKKQQ